jgi:SAM-dependent methyltransferase
MNSTEDSQGFQADVIGHAIWSHYFEQKVCEIELVIDGTEDEPMLSTHFFRTESEMNAAELEALNRCKGLVLDAGAGAGCHALVLQQRGAEVLALERSRLSCEVMRARGVREVVEADVMSLSGQQFDTILLLMNGFGIAGTEDGLVSLLSQLKTLLAPGGRIVGDSTDIRYFKEDSAEVVLLAGSPCEVEFEVRCDGKTQMFPWIYPDEVLLEVLAEEAGLQYQTIMHTDDYHFLCELYV